MGISWCGMKNGMKNGILMVLNGIWRYLINIILTMKHDKWEPNWAFNGLGWYVRLWHDLQRYQSNPQPLPKKK
jgi:hypothetical protein